MCARPPPLTGAPCHASGVPGDRDAPPRGPAATLTLACAMPALALVAGGRCPSCLPLPSFPCLPLRQRSPRSTWRDLGMPPITRDTVTSTPLNGSLSPWHEPGSSPPAATSASTSPPPPATPSTPTPTPSASAAPPPP